MQGRRPAAAAPLRAQPGARRAAAGAGLRARGTRAAPSDESDSESFETDSESDDDARTGCCNLRLVVALLMVAMSAGVWSVGIWYGAMQRPTLASASHNLHRLWDPRAADYNFHRFDVDHDGKFSAKALAAFAPAGTSEAELAKYIARADADADGALNESEYLELLRMERAARHTHREAPADSEHSDRPP